MMNWKETKCGKCKIQRRKPICNSCSNHNRFVPMTNADHIRSFSDEELAEHFSKLIKDTYENEYCDDVNDWLDWLQSEVEE